MCTTNLLFNFSEQAWNEWLAGVIDGDGCFLVSPKGYTSLEITMSINDEHTLLQMKQKLGGSVKLRSGSRSFRYRLHHKKGMLHLLEKVNGLCRHPIRVTQLKLVCEKLGVSFKDPKALNIDNGWFAGFFDADGTISHNGEDYPQLTISVSQKYEAPLKPFKEVFGGRIRFDRSSNVFKWEIEEKHRVIFFCDYVKKYPARSYKQKRIHLVKKFYELRQVTAYKADPSSLLFKAWEKFQQDWKIAV